MRREQAEALAEQVTKAVDLSRPATKQDLEILRRDVKIDTGKMLVGVVAVLGGLMTVFKFAL